MPKKNKAITDKTKASHLMQAHGLWRQLYHWLMGIHQRSSITKQQARLWLQHCHLAARQKKICQRLIVDNKVEARLNLLVIFLSLLLVNIDDKKMRQAIVDRVVFEIDDGLREEGVADMVVGKRVKKLTAKLYARFYRYQPAFEKKNRKELARLLEFYFAGRADYFLPLADYFLSCQRAIEKNSNADSFDGFPVFANK